MRKPDDIGQALLDSITHVCRAAADLDRRIAAGECPPSAASKIEQALTLLSEAQQAIDVLPPVSTIDSTLPIPVSFIGAACGSTWTMRPLVYIDYRKCKRTHLCRGEDAIRQLARHLKEHGGKPSLQDAAKLLQQALLNEDKPEEFWGSLWAGPELVAIEADDAARIEFWRSFLEACWQSWREWKTVVDAKAMGGAC
jgi:hypothetical protein